MKGICKRVLTLLLLCAMLIPLGIGNVSAAAELDLTRDDFSITIKSRNSQEFKNVDLYASFYKIADAVYDPQRNFLTYELRAPYTGYPVMRDYVNAASDPAAAPADVYAIAQEATKIALGLGTEEFFPGEGYPTSALEQSGEAPFNNPFYVGSMNEYESGRGPGIYLVIVRREQDWEPRSRVVVETDIYGEEHQVLTKVWGYDLDYVFRIAPFLMTVPSLDVDAMGNETWKYNVSTTLKTDVKPYGDVELEKRDAENIETMLENAKFKLYAQYTADGYYTDGDDWFTVYPGGEEYYRPESEPIRLCFTSATGDSADENGYYVTNDKGLLTIKDIRPLGLYALVEAEPPAGYKRLQEPIFFYLDENGEFQRVSYVTVVSEFLYHEGGYWQNVRHQPGVYMEEHYDDETGIKHVTVANNGTLPVYLRIRMMTETSKILGFNEEEGWSRVPDDGGENVWYYDAILGPGEMSEELRIDTAGFVPGLTELFCESIPVQYDDNGSAYADWSMEDEGGAGYALRPNASVGGGGYVDGPVGEVQQFELKKYYPIILGQDAKKGFDYFKSNTVSSRQDDLLTVLNERSENPPETPPEVELPETGGMGSTLYYIAGSGLLFGAALLTPCLRKKRRCA